MVLCQVRTESSGLRDTRGMCESALASNVVVCRTFQSLLYLALHFMKNANLMGKKKTWCACVRVC